MRKQFVTYLGNDRFLPGVLVLSASLVQHNQNVGLLILVGQSVSPPIIDFLGEKGLSIRMIKDIENPFVQAKDNRGSKYMYTKIRVFELVEFDKIVFLDADMLVCSNIECLFEKEHMSAVVAGKFMLKNASWVDFNSGLMVIKPEPATFEKMLEVIKTLDSNDRTDQGFLNNFYCEWKSNTGLHLDHKFNLPSEYLDEFCRLSGLDFEYNGDIHCGDGVAVLHFWGSAKPWDIDITGLAVRYLAARARPKYQQSLDLWWDYFYKAV